MAKSSAPVAPAKRMTRLKSLETTGADGVGDNVVPEPVAGWVWRLRT